MSEIILQASRSDIVGSRVAGLGKQIEVGIERSVLGTAPDNLYRTGPAGGLEKLEPQFHPVVLGMFQEMGENDLTELWVMRTGFVRAGVKQHGQFKFVVQASLHGPDARYSFGLEGSQLEMGDEGLEAACVLLQDFDPAVIAHQAETSARVMLRGLDKIDGKGKTPYMDAFERACGLAATRWQKFVETTERVL